MKSLKYIDLFAGAGGLSEGFIRQNFTPVAHVELDVAACFTLKTRIAYHYLHEHGKDDLYVSYLKGEIKREQLYKEIPKHLLDSVINAEIGKDNEQIFDTIDHLSGKAGIDLIIGGPPCQAYSVVGRAALKNKKNDERTTLYIQYGRFLKKYKPKMFIFENVPGILTAAKGKYFSNLKKYYKRLGYNVEAKTLNAYDFGVIQNRERVILIGCKKEKHFHFPEFQKIKNQYTRNDIFDDLPVVPTGESTRYHGYRTGLNNYLKKFSIRNEINFVTQHITRPHNEKDLNIYKLAIELLEKGDRIKNHQIPDDMRTQKNITSFLDRFKVVDKIPHTMIAHIAKDGHHFIHPDKNQLRSISVREAARIQSFPDDYFFEGIKEDQFRTAAYRQIGNAVPPIMAESIAEKIKEMIK